MADTKTITIDEIPVTFKASAEIPRMYRNKFALISTGICGYWKREWTRETRRHPPWTRSPWIFWSSVVLAFECAMEKNWKIISRPKELGDIRGISYIYPILWRFGVIQVPENVAEQMEIQQNRAVEKKQELAERMKDPE